MSDDPGTLEARVGFLVPLNKLPPERRARLLEQSQVITLRKKQTLFKQGERDDFTYYLIDGEIEMYADDSLIKRVTGGDGASFQPLAQLQPRQMSAVAKSKAEILQVKRSLLDQLLSMDEAAPEPDTGMEVEEMEADQGGDWLMTLLQSELFTRIPPSNIQGLLDTLETISLQAGDVVIKQGEPGDFYYAIQSGACEVVRSGANQREIKLAELETGATFGEEALISGAKRNATVRMTRAGDLARLTKEDFSRLIKAPLLNSMTRQQAETKIAAGATWLDVRFEDEFAHNGIAGAVNIPHGTLRTRMDELNPESAYVAYCDTGGRSSAAAFLLAEKGFEIGYVEGGAVTEPIPEKSAAPAPAKKARSTTRKSSTSTAGKSSPEQAQAASSAAPTREQDSQALLEASALASSLSAEAEKAQLTIDKARAMMAEAEAMKREAERVVAEKLAAERNRIDSEATRLKEKLAEAEAVKLESQRAAQARIDEEQQRIKAEASKLEQRLAEAERLKAALTEQHKAAEADAARRQEEVEQRVRALEDQTRERLQTEERRLEALYQDQTAQLESLQADREVELRARLSDELATERRKFEQEVLRTNEELERAQEERRQAIAAKEAAAEEARSTIAEFKAEQQALQVEQQAALDRERQRLQAEAKRIEQIRAEAGKAREAAEAAQQAAELELQQARERAAEAASIADERALDEIEKRASAAQRSLNKAIRAETVVQTAARENEDQLERTYDTATEINLLLEKELKEFVGDQEKFQESTLQREVLSRQKEMVERIKARAAQVQRERETQNLSLLDEIEQQLKKN